MYNLGATSVALGIILLLTFGSLSDARIYERNFNKGNEIQKNIKCAWAPCTNLLMAFQCDSVKHCIRNVWLSSKNPVLPRDTDDVCTICKNMVAQARDQLESNETMSEILEVFDGSCDLIPIKLVAKYCKELFDGFVPQLVETLSSEMNPQLVCATAGLCNSAMIDNFLTEKQRVSPMNNCQYCTSEVRKIQNQISTLGNGLLQKLLELCGYLSSFSDACTQAVEENFKKILRSLLSPQFVDLICYVSAMCSDDMKDKTALISSGSESDVQCEFCEKVIEHWKQLWTDNTTESEFKHVLEIMCHRLSGSSEKLQHCLHIVDQYYIPFYEYITHGINATKICEIVGLCGSNYFMQVDPKTSIFTIFSTGESTDYPENIEDGDRQITSVYPPELKTSKSGCEICQFVLHYLYDILTDKSDEEEIENVLETLCSKLPSSFESKCDRLVETYTRTIIDLIVTGLDVDQVCQKISLCNKPKRKNVVADGGCVLCEYVIQTLDHYLDDKTNEEKIRQALDKVCSHLPKTITKKCVKYVNTYAEEIIEFLTHGVTPEEICTRLHLCKETLKSSKVLSESSTAYVHCTLCEYIISNVDSMLENGQTDKQIQTVVNSICNTLSPAIAKQCHKIVHDNSSLVIQAFLDRKSPEQICSELNQCPLIVPYEIMSNSITPFVDSAKPLCVFCEFVISVLEKRLINGQTLDILERGIDMICSYLPDRFADKCIEFVDDYGDEIIHLLMSEALEPKEVCSALNLCLSFPKDMWDASVYGGTMCPWGPAYWCKSRFHAHACGTFQYCKHHHW